MISAESGTPPAAGVGALAVLEPIVLASLVGEVNALKPGNVHRFAGGHGMSYEDFITSAEQVAPLLVNPAWSMGARILRAVEATRAAVGTNTNLGLLLLFAPLVMAGEQAPAAAGMRPALGKILGAPHKNDARDVFAAIKLARPGGLGHSDQYDVNLDPDCSLLEAMEAAAGRDLIARQFCNAFEQVFVSGLAWLREFEARWNSVEWAIVGCYLRFLAEFPDSHVQRKFGPGAAAQVSRRAAGVLSSFEKKKIPGSALAMLLEYDKELKDANINPGTSADLTAASLLLYLLGARQRAMPGGS